MKYKVGDKVVLKDGRVAKVGKANHPEDYTVKTENHFFLVTDGMIDENKTAELKLDKTLEHYQGELEKIVAEKNNREINNVDINLGKVHGNDTIKPKHYQKNGIDRIELWKLQYSDQSFRDGMRMLADRYFSRYENKNGIEDLFKGIEVIERLIEWEESLDD